LVILQLTQYICNYAASRSYKSTYTLIFFKPHIYYSVSSLNVSAYFGFVDLMFVHRSYQTKKM